MCMFDSNKRLNSHPINLVCMTILDTEGQTVNVDILLLSYATTSALKFKFPGATKRKQMFLISDRG